MPISTMPKISLKEFAEIVSREKAPGDYFVSGLIIRQDAKRSRQGKTYGTGKKSKPIEEIQKELPDSVLVEINSKSDDKEILSRFKSAFDNQKWLVVYLSDGALSPLWREQLTRLRDSNVIFIQGKTVEDTFYAKQQENTRVVVVIDNKNIKNVNYENFLNLFGPVIEI